MGSNWSFHLENFSTGVRNGLSTAMERAAVKYRQWQKRALLLTFFLLVALIIVVAVLLCYVAGVLHGPCPPIANEKDALSIITVSDFGKTVDGKVAKKFLLKSVDGSIEAEVTNLGGILVSLRVPDQNGDLNDIILGYDSLSEYATDTSTYFGAIIGRYANRIAGGTFKIYSNVYTLTKNDHGNTLHGGTIGWNRAVWDYTVTGDVLLLTHYSTSGDQGFPGKVKAEVAYRVVNNNSLEVNFTATLLNTEPTPISLTLHPYFNLNGEGEGNITDHQITIFADYYLPVDNQLIPTGIITPVSGAFDMKLQKKLGDQLASLGGDGFDHNFCLLGPPGMRLAARVQGGKSKIIMEVLTNQPGVQFYTGNFLNVSKGKQGHTYSRQSALCLEPQMYPNSPNQPNFPDSILRPGSTYVHNMMYRFPRLFAYIGG